jgi:hypothetical protein
MNLECMYFFCEVRTNFLALADTVPALNVMRAHDAKIMLKVILGKPT